MNTADTKWLSYSDVRQKQRNSPLRQAEIPVEHAVSLPMPTLRFAFFVDGKGEKFVDALTMQHMWADTGGQSVVTDITH